ncbi:MAG: S41 family peptidase [Treponema sp.]|nr:S41 family peptidase [Treponema sp.]
MNKKICLFGKKVITFFCLSIFASQCFAQSSSVSAKEASDSTLNYLRIINSVFNFAQQNYVEPVDPKVLYEGAMKGMMEALGDPYTEYLTGARLRSLNETTSGNFGGVGLSIMKEVASADKPGYVEVVAPIENTPGEKAGIIAQDYITAIDGEPTPEMTMEQVLSKLRGAVGTSVELTLLRGKKTEFKRTLIRAIIEVPTVKHAMIGTVGYMQLLQFTPETANHVQECIDEFKRKKFTGLIIDLRNNPGGLITSAVEIADKFIDSGTIVSTKSRLELQNSVFTAKPENTRIPKDLPIIVLINRGSASASEILSGALKDYHIGYLVGEKTYGKGSVQQMVSLTDEDGFKMTMARYYTPSDVNIDKVGILPDREVVFDAFTEEEGTIFAEMSKDNIIGDYVEKHPSMTEADIAAYADTLHATYPINLRFLRRLIRLEAFRFRGGITYDLDFDVQLNTALDILRTEDFKTLVKNTKTLKELQDERLKNENLAVSQ